MLTRYKKSRFTLPHLLWKSMPNFKYGLCHICNLTQIFLFPFFLTTISGVLIIFVFFFYIFFGFFDVRNILFIRKIWMINDFSSLLRGETIRNSLPLPRILVYRLVFFNKEMRNTGRIARSVSRRAASAKTSERRKESVPLHVVSRCFPR